VLLQLFKALEFIHENVNNVFLKIDTYQDIFTYGRLKVTILVNDRAKEFLPIYFTVVILVEGVEQ